jgi:hypothetical protein
MENRVNRERDKRQADLLEVRKLIEEAVIGGIHLELGGLVYLLVGILFTSVPEEAASLLQKIGL